jgi:adenylate cyclase
MIKKIAFNPLTILITLLFVIFLRIEDFHLMESFRLRFFDTLILQKETTLNNIHIVNIDDNTLEKLGQWPFPREIYSNIIKDLYDRNAGLVVFNVLMPEIDRFDGDNILSETLKEYPVILPNVPSKKTINTPINPGAAILNSQYIDKIPKYQGIIANINLLESNAIGVGITNTLPEIDGVNRRVPLVVSVDNILYPNLTLEILRVLAGDLNFQIRLNENGIQTLRIPKFGPINTDNLGRIWIDWSQKCFEHSLLNLPESFDHGIVIVGLTAAGLNNPISTSFGAVFPHKLQGILLGTIFNKSNINRPDIMLVYELLIVLFLVLFLLSISKYVYTSLFFFLLIIFLIPLTSKYVFDNYFVLADITFVLGAFSIIILHLYSIKFIKEFIQKQLIKKQFGTYVNPTVVEKLQKNPNLIKLGGERKCVSVVMTDMRNFTALGESFGDAVEEFTLMMNKYMTFISEPIFENNGTLIKFIGDASMHIHGAPLEENNHAYNAVKTTLQMINQVEKFNIELKNENKPPVGMGAGINTGDVIVGNIGSEKKLGYDVLGDAVSVAARLEGQTKSYGVKIIIGPETYEKTKDKFFFLKLDNIAVKGKTIGLKIYTILEKIDQTYKFSKSQHDNMLQLYQNKKFDNAAKECEKLKGHFDKKMDEYYDIWIKRCNFMKTQNLPKDWNGVFVSTTK